MTKTDFKSVDEYIASQPEAVQGVLRRVRIIIRRALPGAEEGISYTLASGPILHAKGMNLQIRSAT